MGRSLSLCRRRRQAGRRLCYGWSCRSLGRLGLARSAAAHRCRLCAGRRRPRRLQGVAAAEALLGLLLPPSVQQVRLWGPLPRPVASLPAAVPDQLRGA